MMAREHKYRAWLKQEKKMFEVSVIHFGVQYGMAPSDRANLVLLCDKSKYYREGEEVELLEYTGRKDRKGNEVYDGDILGNEWGKYRIYWDTDSFIARSEDGFRFHLSDIEFNALEIIGNIYEH